MGENEIASLKTALHQAGLTNRQAQAFANYLDQSYSEGMSQRGAGFGILLQIELIQTEFGELGTRCTIDGRSSQLQEVGGF